MKRDAHGGHFDFGLGFFCYFLPLATPFFLSFIRSLILLVFIWLGVCVWLFLASGGASLRQPITMAVCSTGSQCQTAFRKGGGI